MREGHDPARAALLRKPGPPPQEASAGSGGAGDAARRSLAAVAHEPGGPRRKQLLESVAAHLGLECLEPAPPLAPAEALAAVPPEVARRYGVVPLRAGARSVDLLAVDPFDAALTAELPFALGREVRVIVADPGQVKRLLQRHYGGGAVAEAAAGAGLALAEPPQEESQDDELARRAAEGPVVRYVAATLAAAVRSRANDIHFEPFEGEFRVRCRIDGTLRELAPPPLDAAPAVISRLKVLAGLDIAERRLPQDGRIRLALEGRAADLRISTLPTQGGESVVLRVLNAAAAPAGLGDLGLTGLEEAGLREVLQRPNGIALVTGPTGSGKTTTLYACLRLVNTPGVKVLTAEDPVECELDGVVQVPVNPAAGLTFGAALRAFLRQDPDVLMVGEIRDLDTARIAVQAALTGHLVLSTLHTNDAVGTIARLLDMGVEPYLLCATLEGVLAQRLVRRICPDCREETVIAPGSGAGGPGNAGRRCVRGRGCAACQFTGYRGRMGIFEWLRIDDAVRALVMQRAPAAAIRAQAALRGLRPLREAATAAVEAGQTTPEEAARYS